MDKTGPKFGYVEFFFRISPLHLIYFLITGVLTQRLPQPLHKVH